MVDPSRRPAVHSVLGAYAQRNRIDAEAFRPDGSMCLVFDAVYRVTIRSLPDGRMLFLSPVLDLWALPGSEQDDFLLRLLRTGAGLIRDHACGLAVDETRNRLVLQQVLPAGASVQDMEDQLADFLNVLGFWRSICTDATSAGSAWRGAR